jgi:hypothetical protein
MTGRQQQQQVAFELLLEELYDCAYARLMTRPENDNIAISRTT